MSSPFEIPGQSISRITAADLSAKQYYLVALDSGGLIDVAGDGAAAVGVLQDKPASGEVGNVMVSGTTRCIASEAIAMGALVSSDTGGKAETADSTDYIVGKALTAAAADGEYFTLLLQHEGKKA